MIKKGKHCAGFVKNSAAVFFLIRIKADIRNTLRCASRFIATS
jgi:hypothetical protein